MRRKKNIQTIKVNKVILVGILFLFGAIIARLVIIGISPTIDGIDLRVFAANRNTTRETVFARRGSIFDTNGEILAQNVNSYTVIAFLSPRRTTNANMPRHVVDKHMTAQKLSPIINMSEERILELLSRNSYQVELGPGGRGITDVKRNAILELDLPGIGFTESFRRHYKMGNFAPHTIGFAIKDQDSEEITGKMGIEAYFNDILKGRDGFTEFQRDGHGFRIPNTPSINEDPVAGSDIYLTLDNNIQFLVESTISELRSNFNFEWMTLSIANARTGALLASGAYPNFNLNTLEDIQSYLNPLVSFSYEPGSTMKTFSWMAAMEHGFYDGSRTFPSRMIRVGDYEVWNNNRDNWGDITFDEGFLRSSNVGSVFLGNRLGRSRLRDYYTSLGFGEKTGISLPGELPGVVNFRWDIEVANATFGQGLTTTPIQNLQALTAIANDGIMVRPFIVDRIVDENGKVTFQGGREEVGRVASKETTDKIRELMHGVVYEPAGTGRGYRPENTTFIGKTGTAQFTGPNGEYVTGEFQNIRSFAGMFPKENPQYVLYLSVKRYNGPLSVLGRQIASVVDAIAKQDFGINENYVEIDETRLIRLDNYINRSVETTTNKLNELKLQPIILGSGDRIINQFPLRNTTVIEGTKIFLLTNRREFIMPDVTSWSHNEIRTFCSLINLECHIEGFGKVIEASIPKDTKIEFEAPLIIKLG